MQIYKRKDKLTKPCFCSLIFRLSLKYSLKYTIQTMDYYSAVKRNELSAMKRHGGRSLKCMLTIGRIQSEKATLLCDPNCMTLWKRQNCGNDKMIRAVGGSGGQRFSGCEWSVWYTGGHESYICLSPSKYNTKSDLNVNYSSGWQWCDYVGSWNERNEPSLGEAV